NVNGENGWYITKPMINLTASKPATIYYHWDEDDKQVYLHNITAPEGVHTIFYYSVDTSGTREEVQWKTLKVDTTKPYLESVYPGNNSFINNTKPVLKLNFSEEIQTIHSSLDNHEIEFNTNDNITFTVNTSLAEGKHRLRVEVKDEAGNQVSYVMEFTVDVTKPTAKVDLPSADDVVSEKNVYVTVNATDNYGVNQIEFKVIQGNTTFNSSTFSGEEKHVFVFNTSSYPDGSYTLVVRVSDYAGNSAIYSTTVTVSKEEVASPLLLLLLGIMVSTGFFIVYIVAVKRMKGKMVFQWIFHRILRNH
ncbi:MAG TPA: hypothetical protein ENI42_03880, partial [Thermoplasmatales archaeon]|nr:hypothetical protein [Thermoplasmatales archaeon]